MRMVRGTSGHSFWIFARQVLEPVSVATGDDPPIALAFPGRRIEDGNVLLDGAAAYAHSATTLPSPVSGAPPPIAQ